MSKKKIKIIKYKGKNKTMQYLYGTVKNNCSTKI